MEKPFWEATYQDKGVSTFSKGPTTDVNEYAQRAFVKDKVV